MPPQRCPRKSVASEYHTTIPTLLRSYKDEAPLALMTSATSVGALVVFEKSFNRQQVLSTGIDTND